MSRHDGTWWFGWKERNLLCSRMRQPRTSVGMSRAFTGNKPDAFRRRAYKGVACESEISGGHTRYVFGFRTCFVDR